MHPAELDLERRGRSARRRASFLCPRLLHARQRALQSLGRDQQGPRRVPAMDGRQRDAARAGRLQAPCPEGGLIMIEYKSTEMMTVAAARMLRNEDVCFVGIGLPSAACNLARLSHAP